MKCPNCGREMIDKSYSKLEEFYHWEDVIIRLQYQEKVKMKNIIIEIIITKSLYVIVAKFLLKMTNGIFQIILCRQKNKRKLFFL